MKCRIELDDMNDCNIKEILWVEITEMGPIDMKGNLIEKPKILNLKIGKGILFTREDIIEFIGD